MGALIVGIDVSKDRLDVHILPPAESFVIARTDAGVDELVGVLSERKVLVIALEATGGFERVVSAALAGAGLPVVVVNPAQVRAFAVALGKRAKETPTNKCVI